MNAIETALWEESEHFLLCQVANDRSSPHSASPTVPQQGTQSITCFYEAGDRILAAHLVQSLLPVQENQITIANFRSPLNLLIPCSGKIRMPLTCTKWNTTETMVDEVYFSPAICLVQDGNCQKDCLFLGHPFPGPSAREWELAFLEICYCLCLLAVLDWRLLPFPVQDMQKATWKPRELTPHCIFP